MHVYKIKRIESLLVLKKEINKNDQVWLLLYKKGSNQNERAFSNYQEAGKKIKNSVLLFADVNLVNDIHPEYQIASVPTLLGFGAGKMKKIFKGFHNAKQLQAIIGGNVFQSGQDE